ncbi:MAG: hypothetical protein ACR2QC_06740 [Gammaproteobacteria bacterium]
MSEFGGARRKFSVPGRRFAAFFAIFLAAGALSACGGLSRLGEAAGGLPQFGADDGDAPAIQRNAKDGDVELILHPIAVWDETGVSPSAKISADGREFMARPRDTGFLERPFARAGLFWHSRLDHIFMPVVVLGPPAEIRKVEIHAGGNRAQLRRAPDSFKFTPAQAGGSQKISSAVFELKPRTLRAVSAADTARLIVSTNRGVLNLGLDVVGGDSPEDFRRNARILFAQFAEKMAAEKKAGG